MINSYTALHESSPSFLQNTSAVEKHIAYSETIIHVKTMTNSDETPVSIACTVLFLCAFQPYQYLPQHALLRSLHFQHRDCAALISFPHFSSLWPTRMYLPALPGSFVWGCTKSLSLDGPGIPNPDHLEIPPNLQVLDPEPSFGSITPMLFFFWRIL